MACHNFGKFPCGKCPGCLDSRSSGWSVRLSHELLSHEASSFITLTYADDDGSTTSRRYCPYPRGSVAKIESVDFLKRLRYYLSHKKIRFYLVSEYGEKTRRPHYHAIIFGHDFSKDPGAHQVRRGLYASPILDKAWGLGHASSGSVSEASIRYVTNYILGKNETPEAKAKTFALMSRKPGLGNSWIDSHSAETYRRDRVRVGSFERRPPRYYDTVAFKDDESAQAALRDRRRESGIKNMLRFPDDHLVDLSPEKKIADAKLWIARKKMTQGEL